MTNWGQSRQKRATARATAQEKNANSDRCLWSWALAAFRVSPSRADEGRRGPPQLTAAELICQFVVLNPLLRTENGEPFSAWKSGDHPDIPAGDEAGSNRARRWAHLLR